MVDEVGETIQRNETDEIQEEAGTKGLERC